MRLNVWSAECTVTSFIRVPQRHHHEAASCTELRPVQGPHIFLVLIYTNDKSDMEPAEMFLVVNSKPANLVFLGL